MPPMTVSCEFIASGTGQGGWTLILNYLHNANTNPELDVRHYSLPTKGSDSLGTNESGTTHWGHAAPGLLNNMDFSSMRWYCETSEHTRKLHFVSSDADMVEYARTGRGTDMMSNVEDDADFFAGSVTDFGDVSFYDNQGDLALTNFPFFYDGGNSRWAIYGNEDGWECDTGK